MLLEAGANPNSRRLDGATPLYMAAQYERVGAVKALLRAKANPMLTCSRPSGESSNVPLDVAAQNGHVEVTRELVQQGGIEMSGGASGGVDALCFAAEYHQAEIMGVLISAGVDTGVPQMTAAMCGSAAAAKHLLQHHERTASGDGAACLNALSSSGRAPLCYAIEFAGFSSSRIVRLLVDAGADTASAVHVADAGGRAAFHGTPLALTNLYLHVKKFRGEEATEQQLHSLEATRRVLLTVEAAHAVS